ncbi:FUSC family protein [Oceanobacillus damuensis]|uniref:FUSC family protein n=1 Tax=Oceanobacillus damuensis TaxID=937928 RepID=UPI001F1C2514|nr:FUSC family protein [Oceanobacillus damuensis]
MHMVKLNPLKIFEKIGDRMRQGYKNHWFLRLLASDPGQIRLYQAGKATISLILSLFTTLLIIGSTGNEALMPGVVSAVVGMMGIMTVMDETKQKKKITTILLGIAAMFGITLGSLLPESFYLIDALMLLLIFSSFYLTRFGVRYFSLSMMGFMTVYISSVFTLSSGQLPWFYLGISIGAAYAYLLNFILFQSTAKRLKRSIHSFHIQSNLTFELLIEGIRYKELTPSQQRQLQKHVLKLRQYAIIVSDYINKPDVKKLWPGLSPAQLRLYVFDTGMLVETLTNSIRSLKEAEALEMDELRRILLWTVEALKDTKVLARDYEKQNLEEAELAIQALRLLIEDLFNRDQQPEEWLFLIRRIESIMNHVIKGAITIQQSLYTESQVEDAPEEAAEKPDSEEKGLKPSTKKAYQSLIAGALAIIVGQIISPAQPYWVLLTTFIVLLGTQSIGRIYAKGYQRSLGTIIGAVLGFTTAKLLSGHSAIEVILIFIVIFLAFYLLSVSYTLMSVFITMLIAFLYDILMGGITFSLIGARVTDTIVGAAIAFGVSSFIFPTKTKDKVAESINDYLIELKPYITEYVKSFKEDVNVKGLSETAFKLDQKLQTIKDEAEPITQRTESPASNTTNRWITVIAAINYYARQLVASSYRKGFDYPEELTDVFSQIEEKLEHNIDTLTSILEGKSEPHNVIFRLDDEREQIERHSPQRHESKRDLIHHLYYIWRINQAIVELGIETGAKEDRDS